MLNLAQLRSQVLLTDIDSIQRYKDVRVAMNKTHEWPENPNTYYDGTNGKDQWVNWADLIGKIPAEEMTQRRSPGTNLNSPARQRALQNQQHQHNPPTPQQPSTGTSSNWWAAIPSYAKKAGAALLGIIALILVINSLSGGNRSRSSNQSRGGGGSRHTTPRVDQSFPGGCPGVTVNGKILFPSDQCGWLPNQVLTNQTTTVYGPAQLMLYMKIVGTAKVTAAGKSLIVKDDWVPTIGKGTQTFNFQAVSSTASLKIQYQCQLNGKRPCY